MTVQTSTTVATGVATWSADRLADLAETLAAAPERWVDRVRLNAENRWYERIHNDDDHEVWLISWLPGRSTGFHDHGGSRGALAVALGSLVEEDLTTARTLHAGQVRAFGPNHVHDVRNTTAAPAISVHAYSPPLTLMNRYDRTEAGLIPLAPEYAEQW